MFRLFIWHGQCRLVDPGISGIAKCKKFRSQVKESKLLSAQDQLTICIKGMKAF